MGAIIPPNLYTAQSIHVNHKEISKFRNKLSLSLPVFAKKFRSVFDFPHSMAFVNVIPYKQQQERLGCENKMSKFFTSYDSQ